MVPDSRGRLIFRHRPYRAVLFDAGGTLVDTARPFGDLLADICREHGTEADADRLATASSELFAALGRMRQRGLRYGAPEECGRLWQWFYLQVVLRCGLERPKEIARALWADIRQPSRWMLYPDALPTLSGMRQAGVFVGVVSNWDAWLPGLLEALGAGSYLGLVVTSAQAGAEKPDPTPLRVALATAGVPAAETLYVGNHPSEDAEAAHRAGVACVLVARPGARREPGYPWIEDLRELLADTS